MSKKYDPLKGINMTTKMLATESIGYGVAGQISGSITGPGADVSTKAFSTGSSLAGIPSLTYSAGNVMKSLDSLYKKKK
jgi:hypothetical protein